ncbi:RNA polymerase I termination factor [Lecanosticta acicola]|uniref:RNA polymerase I termination factor n=1 Tax=Lecanosticta acicola TaxID=111012 RepID=A0AAI8Z641_9PEZI|nr:RNA polymerase I termination factor [Lecanosticta acicola]
MGQSSSQLDQSTQQSQSIEQPPPADAAMPDEPRREPARTTASEQLERDLLQASQESPEKPKKKHKKRKRESQAHEEADNAQRHTSPRAGSPKIDQVDQRLDSTPEMEPSSKHQTPEEKTLATMTYARKDVQRMLKKKELEEIVFSNKGYWKKLPDGNWGVKLFTEGETPPQNAYGNHAAELVALAKKDIERIKYVEGVALENERNAREKVEQARTGVLEPEQRIQEHTEKAEKQIEKQAGKHIEKHIDERIDDEPTMVEPNVTAATSAKRTTKARASRRARPKNLMKQTEKGVSESVDRDETPQIAKEANAATPHDPIFNMPRHVEHWLDDHATHGVEELTKNTLPSGLVSSVKRKRKSQYQADDSDEYADDVDDGSLGPGDSYSVVEPPRKKPKTKSTSWPNAKEFGVYTTGPLTAEERAIADRVFESTRKSCNLTEAELKAKIMDYRQAPEFREGLENALPDRTKETLRKFAQRRYHPYQRGAWTTEEDQALRDAHAKWPGKWAQISKTMERTADDCKDHWRKVLSKTNIGPWSEEEEHALMARVEEAIGKIKHEYREDEELVNDTGRLESLVSWTRIAETLGNKRTMKQCREKYNKLKSRTAKVDSVVQSQPTQDEAEVGGVEESEDEASKKKTKRSKLNEANAHLNKFELGDYYDVFVEIHTTFPDPNAHYSSEDIIWSMVPWKNQGSRFSMSYLGGALRKAAFENACRHWPDESKKIKRKLERAETIPAKALALTKIIEKRTGKDQMGALPRLYEPELVGKSSDEILRIKKERKEARKRSREEAYNKNGLSKDVVSDSEAEGEAKSAEAEAKVKARSKRDTTEKKDLSKEMISDSEAESQAVPIKSEASATRAISATPESEDADAEANATPELSEDEGLSPDGDRDRERRSSEVEGEDEDEDEDEDEQGTQKIPETQPDPSEASEPPVHMAAPAEPTPKSSLKKDSKLSRQEFMRRCSDSSKAKKPALTPSRRRPITYSKKPGSGRRRV